MRGYNSGRSTIFFPDGLFPAGLSVLTRIHGFEIGSWTGRLRQERGAFKLLKRPASATAGLAKH